MRTYEFPNGFTIFCLAYDVETDTSKISTESGTEVAHYEFFDAHSIPVEKLYISHPNMRELFA